MHERKELKDEHADNTFDLDGTLIDTNQLIFESFKHTFEQFKLDFTDEEIIEFNGPPLWILLRRLIQSGQMKW